jgi:hypothetical protein
VTVACEVLTRTLRVTMASKPEALYRSTDLRDSQDVGLFEKFEVNRDPRWQVVTKLVGRFARPAPRVCVVVIYVPACATH